MFNCFPDCIFCEKSLRKNQTGEGEHVIPRNIYGFWRIYDVCDECMEYFGNYIDQLAIQNPLILEAMQKFNLPNADKYYDNLSYTAEDFKTGDMVEMTRKDGHFKPKVNIEGEDLFECAEEDWEIIGIKWLRDILKDKLPDDELAEALEELKEKYKDAEPGEIIQSDKLDYSIRKSRTHKVKIADDTEQSITPLLAKINISFLHYFLTKKQLEHIIEYKMLFSHARYGGRLKEYLINWCTLADDKEYNKYHELTLRAFDGFPMVDITLFGYLNWRTVLTSSSKIILYDNNGRELDGIKFILDFENLEKRQKYLGLKYSDKTDLEFYKLHA